MIELQKMSETEFNEFLILSKRNYTNDKMRANDLSKEEATEIAEADFNRYLPDGYGSPNNYLFVIKDKENNQVGHLWYVTRGPEEKRKAYIADIFLHADFRGKGYGRKTMELLEDEVKSQGLGHIGLHVFGFNTAAINLYQSLGYETTDLVMEKTL